MGLAALCQVGRVPKSLRKASRCHVEPAFYGNGMQSVTFMAVKKGLSIALHGKALLVSGLYLGFLRAEHVQSVRSLPKTAGCAP